MTSIVSLSGPPKSDTEGAPDPDKVVSGEPKTRSQPYFASDDGSFVSGVWHSTPGKWRAVAQGKDEFCYLTRGRLRLISDCGAVFEYEAGQSFVVPHSFTGFWDIIEDCTKHYAIRKYS